MSTTLLEHPPQQAPEQQPQARRIARPNAFDRLALRVGLMLITYGRRSYAKPPKSLPAHDAEYERRLRDLSWNRSQWTMRPSA